MVSDFKYLWHHINIIIFLVVLLLDYRNGVNRNRGWVCVDNVQCGASNRYYYYHIDFSLTNWQIYEVRLVSLSFISSWFFFFALNYICKCGIFCITNQKYLCQMSQTLILIKKKKRAGRPTHSIFTRFIIIIMIIIWLKINNGNMSIIKESSNRTSFMWRPRTKGTYRGAYHCNA